MERKRIGIPRALLYHKYYAHWKSMFEALGLDVITSPATNEGILSIGLRHSTADLCLPVKSMLGHAGALAEAVDFLFIPRYISIEKDAYMCPKFIGLPDVVRASFKKLPPVIAPEFNVKVPGEVDRFSTGIAKALSLKKKTVREAYETTMQTPEPMRAEFSDDAPNIAITGRPYLLFDDHLSKGIIRSLRRAGANVVYFDPTADEITACMSALPKWVYWSFGKEVVTSAYMHFNDERISGIINLSNATCGPDSFTGELIKRFREGRTKPYMSISIDEHTADAGLQTRLEAFLDMMLMSHEKSH